MGQSGGPADFTKLASESGLSRHTVKAHIEAMTIAHAIFPVRPFHGGGRREIIHRPKIFAFDTGFVTHARGWDTIRDEDRGILWEHLVLDALRASGREHQISYWRDKSGRELDFVLHRGGKRVDVLQCKISADRFDPTGLAYLQSLYPQGENWIITPNDDSGFARRVRGLKVQFAGIAQILSKR
jgi:predicted AAA+ superfamily ATPase